MTIPKHLIEELARAWASIDGRADRFDIGKNWNGSQSESPDGGTYEGYLADTEELVKRSPSVAAALSVQFIEVGGVGAMPGSNGGFTMAAFKAPDVPLDAILYIKKERANESN